MEARETTGIQILWPRRLGIELLIDAVGDIQQGRALYRGNQGIGIIGFDPIEGGRAVIVLETEFRVFAAIAGGAHIDGSAGFSGVFVPEKAMPMANPRRRSNQCGRNMVWPI